MPIVSEQKANQLKIFVDDFFFNVSLARDFKKSFMQNMVNDLKNITLDLSKVKVLDSIAVGLLVQAQTVCAQEDIIFTIINVHPEIMDLFTQVKLDKILNVKPGFDNFDND